MVPRLWLVVPVVLVLYWHSACYHGFDLFVLDKILDQRVNFGIMNDALSDPRYQLSYFTEDRTPMYFGING